MVNRGGRKGARSGSVQDNAKVQKAQENEKILNLNIEIDDSLTRKRKLDYEP